MVDIASFSRIRPMVNQVETHEIVPAEPYSSDDLNYNNDTDRVSVEHQDPDLRPALGGEELDLSSYDTIFLGYPPW